MSKCIDWALPHSTCVSCIIKKGWQVSACEGNHKATSAQLASKMPLTASPGRTASDAHSCYWLWKCPA